MRSYPSTAFRKWSRLIIKGFAFFMLLAAATASYYGVMRLAGNFHTTIPGELYRSAQPTPSQLASYKKTYDIKTIVNLRGENSGRIWYDKEVTASSQLGLKHLDFRMSSRQELSQSEATALRRS